MKLLIWGTTPLAAWLAATLSPQHDVIWLIDAETDAALQRDGHLSINQQPVPLDVITLTQQFKPDVDLILLATPNWQTVAVLMEMQQTLGFGNPPPPVLSLQNGVGSLNRIDSAFGEQVEPFSIAAAVTRPFWFAQFADGKPIRCRINTRNIGGVALQVDHPLSETIGQMFREIGLTVTFGWADAIQWSSVLWGIQANAIAAILDIPPQEVYQNPHWFAHEHDQLQEALRVIDRLGVQLMRLPGVNVPMIANQARYLPRAIMPYFIANHPRPPALKDDLRFGTGRSEAAYFNGAIAVHGHDLDIPTPINHALALTLTDIAEGRMLWSQFKANPSLLESSIRLAM